MARSPLATGPFQRPPTSSRNWAWESMTSLSGRASLNRGHEVAQVRVALHEAGLPRLQRVLVRPVFDFDTDRARLTCVGEHGEEAAPVDVTHPRQLGRVVLVGMREDPDFVQPLAVDSYVLGVNVKQAVLE